MADAKKGKASEDQFDLLHNILTAAHIEKIKSGECTASDLKAAGEWLKANSITGVAAETTPLGALRLLVPKIDEDDIQRRIGGS
jgi:hypothetical protein